MTDGSPAPARTPAAHRRRVEQLREALRLYQDLRRRGESVSADQRHAASEALRELGAAPEPADFDATDYDHRLYGPLLGVSDEGSAAEVLAEAAARSPKALALGTTDPRVIGLALDAERMTTAGEVPVGPAEYRKIVLGAGARTLLTTNVGVRANVRLHLAHPAVRVRAGSEAERLRSAREEARAIVEPFWKTPGGSPRDLTVFVQFDSGARARFRRRILEKLADAFRAGEIGDPKKHRVGLLASVRPGRSGVRDAMRAIDDGKEVGLREVALDGPLRPLVSDLISLPGILNFFEPDAADEVLRRAAEGGVRVTPWRRLDVATTARNAWSNLQTARSLGFHLGKYGLLPLTFEEQRAVVADVQRWWGHWCAAPAFYVDQPMVFADGVSGPEGAAQAARRWLDMVAGEGVRVVLFDSPGRHPPRRLLKRTADNERGVLSMAQLRRLQARAEELGVRVLWAGGISTGQVYELGRLGVFGIYTTSTTAVRTEVSESIGLDPLSAFELEPTLEGVLAVKCLLEAGFLAESAKAAGDDASAEEIARRARALDASGAEGSDGAAARDALADALVRAWPRHVARASRRAGGTQ